MSRESDIMELIKEIIELKKYMRDDLCPDYEYKLANNLCGIDRGLLTFPNSTPRCSECIKKYYEDMENFYLKKYKINIDNF